MQANRKPQPGEWIRAYAQVQVAADRQILDMLSDAQHQLAADMSRISGGTVTDAIRYQQMAIMRQAILAKQGEVLRKMGDVVEARRLEAASRAVQLGDAVDAYVLERLGRSDLAREVASNLQFGLARTTQVAMARMELSYTELAQRIYNTDVWLGSRIDQKITAALARGLTAREFAKEAQAWFDPNVPGGVRYAALRLARSEINNAFHAVAVQQVQDKPWVHAMQWHLSGSHPKADICDEYANEDKFDLGPGIWPKGDVPRKPHPHCYCYVTGVEIDEDEFLANLTNGNYDKWIADRRAMGAVEQPKVPSAATVKNKANATPARSPGEATSATRIANAKTMHGDFEANPALLGRMGMDDLRSLARAYGAPGTGSRSTVTAAIRSKMPKRPTAAPATKRATPAPKVVPKAATKEVPRKAPAPASGPMPPRTTEVKARNPVKQAQLDEALDRQARLAPNATRKLLRANEMTADEVKEFTRRFGQDAVGGYVPGEYRMTLHPSAFGERSTAALQAEIRSGYSSRIGDGVSGLDGTFAHEFGHHLSYVSRLLGPSRTKGIWDAVADGAGIGRPSFYDRASLDRWVAKHKDVLGKSVSRYGVTDSEELLAEIWAEFSTNPNARPHIKKAALALRDMAEEIAMML